MATTVEALPGRSGIIHLPGGMSDGQVDCRSGVEAPMNKSFGKSLLLVINAQLFGRMSCSIRYDLLPIGRLHLAYWSMVEPIVRPLLLYDRH